MEELFLTNESFDSFIKNADLPVIVDFFAPWCGPCKMMGAILKEFSEEYGDKAIIAKIDTDAEEELAGRFGIMSVPTVKIFKEGKEVYSLNGVQSKARLLELIK